MSLVASARSPQGKLARAAGLALVCSALALSGCQKTYYNVLEKVGVEKRELLARRVTKAKESQQEAQKEFRDALEEFQAVTGHRGGELEDKYDDLREAFERSDEQARDVRERIDAVESVAAVCIARRFTPGSRLGPLGTAQLSSTASSSKRKS